jgi:hypothetical protein
MVLLDLRYPLQGYCDFCIASGRTWSPLTSKPDTQPLKLRRSEKVLFNFPRADESTITDMRTRISYSYDADARYEWDQPIPITDLYFLHLMVERLNYHIINAMTNPSATLPTEMLNWFSTSAAHTVERSLDSSSRIVPTVSSNAD